MVQLSVAYWELLVISTCRWDQDKWTRGVYSSVTVDSTYEDPDLLRQSVADRVFFAGEATNYEYQGALQAAYLSGCHAAAEVTAGLSLTI